MQKFWIAMTKASLLIMFIAIISACGVETPERSRPAEEIAVYSALINEQLEVPFSYLMGDPILIINTTNYEIYGEIEDNYLYDNASSLKRDTLVDFKTVNQSPQILDLPLSVNKPYEYIVFPTDENSWIEFGQKYPNAISITTLSRIGFNRRLDEALVYMAYFCGNECGSASIYLLVREGDIWKVEDSVEVWAS